MIQCLYKVIWSALKLSFCDLEVNTLEKKEKKIPEVVIRRLPRYYRYLEELEKSGKTKISSKALSEKMGVTASQIRQDFNYFGGFGQQGYGYNIKYLLNEMADIFGISKGYTAIIVGAGHIGQALANYAGIEKRGFKIAAVFDRDKNKIGSVCNGITVYGMEHICDYVSENNIDIAMLALPKEAIEEVADMLIDCGIKGLWNFAYAELKTKKPVPVENVHLTDSLMTLSFKIKQNIK